MVSVSISGDVGRKGERTGSLYTSNLYVDYLGGLYPKGCMDIGDIVIGDAWYSGYCRCGTDSDFACSKGCNLGPVIFLVATVLPCPFLGRIGGTLL